MLIYEEGNREHVQVLF